MGKTTLAAKAALDHARLGYRALVVSFDQAHSLKDVVGWCDDRAVAADIVRVQDGLDLLELNTLELVEEGYRTLATILAMSGTGHEHGVRFGAVAPEEVIGAPGVQEFLGLRRIVELVAENTWHTVFVDLPATADAMRTLQLPDLICGYLERLWPQHDRIVAGTGTDPRLTIVVAMIERVVVDAEAVRNLFFDRTRTTVSLVLTPERVGVAEARRTISAAALTGLPIDSIMVNMVLPQLNSASVSLVGAHPAVFWFESWRSAQQSLLAEIEQMASGYSLVLIERAALEPVGLGTLGALEVRDGITRARVRYDEAGATSGRDVGSSGIDSRGEDAAVVAHESGSGLESVYTMTMLLPIVDSSTLSLGRVQDDLIVGADGTRSRVRLASVLRRCIVTGADFESEKLVVRFKPDPSVWPT